MRVYDSKRTEHILIENKELVYSKNEIDTGKTWIDGKQIYRKVLYIQSINIEATQGIQESVHYKHDITNLNTVINVNIIWYDTIDNVWFSGFRQDNSNVYIRINNVSNTDVVLIGDGTDWTSRTKNAYLIIEYTKS